MMYMHYCKSCHRIFMLNGHKMICPKCTDPLTELRISYLDYVNLSLEDREALCNDCADEDKLKKMKATYRMYKYSKWYRELQAQNVDNLPVTTVLASMAKQKKSDNSLQQKNQTKTKL